MTGHFPSYSEVHRYFTELEKQLSPAEWKPMTFDDLMKFVREIDERQRREPRKSLWDLNL